MKIRELVVALGAAACVVGCREPSSTESTGIAPVALQESAALPESAAPGTVAMSEDPKTGQMVTHQIDSAGKWHTVDMAAALREFWKIPPELTPEEAEEYMAKQPERKPPSEEEMNALMQKHYLD